MSQTITISVGSIVAFSLIFSIIFLIIFGIIFACFIYFVIRGAFSHILAEAITAGLFSRLLNDDSVVLDGEDIPIHFVKKPKKSPGRPR
jgi:uncharacterized SAM-binding protein YcdF (DUF218 family)